MHSSLVSGINLSGIIAAVVIELIGVVSTQDRGGTEHAQLTCRHVHQDVIAVALVHLVVGAVHREDGG